MSEAAASIETREVEVFRCWDNGTWDTDWVEIPASTLPEDVEDVATQAGFDAIASSADQPFFVGLYCDPGFCEENTLE